MSGTGERTSSSGRGEQGTGAEGLTPGRPVRAGPNQQPLAMEVHLGIIRHIDRGSACCRFSRYVVPVEERDAVLDDITLETDRMVVFGPDAHVILRNFEHDLGIGQRLATPPAPDLARVTGGGKGAGPEIGADEHGVGIDPVDTGLGGRKDEAVARQRCGSRGRTRGS